MTNRGPALAAILVLVVVLSLGVASDADLWWHVAAGREILEGGPPHTDTWSYIASGSLWIHHEWLYGAALAVVFDAFGNPGLLLFRGGWLALLALALGVAVHRRTKNAALTVTLVGLPLPLIAFLCNLRPQTATWALVPVAVVVLDKVWEGSRAAVFAAVLLMVLWVNLHGGFLFGWGLLGLGLASCALGIDGRQRLAWLGVSGVCIAPFLNVYGLDLIRYVATELTIGHPNLPEWNPPGPVIGVVIAMLVATTLLLSALGRVRIRATLVVAFLVALLGSMRAAKFVQLLLILTPILVAPQLAVWVGKQTARSWLLPVVTVVLALFAGRMVRTPGQVSVDLAVYPLNAVRWLAPADGREARLLVPLGWGGVAHYHLPSWTVSLDGRNTTVYEPAWVQAHTEAMISGDLEVLLRGDPQVALLRTGGPAEINLRRAGWSQLYRDDVAVVLSRINLSPGRNGPAAPTFP